MMIDIVAHRNFPSSTRRFVDARWPAVAAAIQHLRHARRRSVRIVDAECGDGRLLVQAARYARALGFTAIEGRGIDADPSAISGARTAAARVCDPAIGLSFEAGDMLAALADETEFPADILLWEGGAGARPHVADAVVAAGALSSAARRRARPSGWRHDPA